MQDNQMIYSDSSGCYGESPEDKWKEQRDDIRINGEDNDDSRD